MFILRFSLSSKKRKIAKFLFVLMLIQILSPISSFALTSGPSQPEFQAFTPVGATDMVDLFSGDFSYNIPLMDVDGYPINISYHNVSNADQESSWVGLGWNINLGEIDRSVRGLPDDFKGETIEKVTNVKLERDSRLDLGLKLEIFGISTQKIKKLLKAFSKGGSASGKLGIYYGNNNYYGQYGGVSLGLGTGLSGKAAGLSAGINMDFSSNEGADVGVSCNYSYHATSEKKSTLGMGIGMSHGFNTRNGYKDMVISGTISARTKDRTSIIGKKENEIRYGAANFGFGQPITSGLINYIPTLTNQAYTDGYCFGLSVAGIKIIGGLYGTISGSYTHSVTKTESDGSKNAYGYMYLGNSNENNLVDFTRDNGGIFNKNIPNLPMSSLTYDMFSVNAQGAGGSFRPYRNDLGMIHDPRVYSPNMSENLGVAAEIGIGTLAEVGVDVNYTNVKFESGLIPSDHKHFFPGGSGFFTTEYLSSNQEYKDLYEPYYFKQQGENSGTDEFSAAINGSGIYNGNAGVSKRNTLNREPRVNMIYTYNTAQAMTNDVAFIKKIESYTSNNGLQDGYGTSRHAYSKDTNNRAAHHISEVTQISSAGERYVFGIPAMNNVSVDVTQGVSESLPYNYQTGICNVSGIGSNAWGNSRDELSTYTKTPAYAHSYLLSAILSSDYIDVTNDGISPDDLGTYVKFNYSLKNADYRWRMPYANNGDSAYYEMGYDVDPGDNRASFSVGSKEIWYAHSIETKNMVAEFYTAEKEDGKGVSQVIHNTAYSGTAPSRSTYKLDSIKLFNKNDRFINGAAAIPIKTIYFEYDYSLCKNTPNSDAVNGGKLTLKRIYTKFGQSDKTLLSPYQFEYSSFNPDYNAATKNRWGTYQPIDPVTPNYRFPYLNAALPKDSTDKFASAWQMTNIKLPTGGEIRVTYESDDYAFVQNKRASEMTKVVGMGSDANFSSASSNLYIDKDNCNDYIIVKKRGANYFANDLKKVFLDNDNLIYFSYAVDLTHKNFNGRDNFDQVKGFAEVLEVGTCPDNSDYLYIKIDKKKLDKGQMKLSPITYAGINLARRDLSRFLHPGGDNPSFGEMFMGVISSIGEMMNSLMMINPVKSLVNKSKAKNFDPNRSFVRLTAPDLKKTGGGCRVKRIELNDNWNKLVDGEPVSSFGNEYDYTTTDPTYKTISSGVASYEPQIGGDENPCKGIVNYKIQKGSWFPRNEPLHDMQFTPVGETFYPAPSVGYSKVTTKSIHEPYAYSAQAYVQNEFYTARDFPVILKQTKLAEQKVWKPYLVRNENSWYGKQSYSLILNDMHGKPKKTTNFAKRDPGIAAQKDLVSSIEYVYAKNADGELDNMVKTLNYNTSNGAFDIKDMVLGQEIEVTSDSRYSRQRNFTAGIEINVNVEVPPFIIIPTAIPNLRWDIKKFGSYVTTKIVQQYGILKETIITTDKAVNKTRNEIYNPETGQAIVKSYNNEFGDREYETAYPASWAYKGMSATYKNLFYQGKFDSIKVDTCKIGGVYLTGDQSKTLCPGDEIILSGAGLSPFKVWLGDIEEKVEGYFTPSGTYLKRNFCFAKVYPRDPASAAWTGSSQYNQVNFEVIRSGRKNQLESSIQTFVGMKSPVVTNTLTFTPSKLISLGTSTYDNKNVIYYNDDCTVNPYIVGRWGNFRPANSYVFYKNRTYTGHNRTEGTFDIGTGDGFWTSVNGLCSANLTANANSNWKAAFAEIWYNSWGTEVQNSNILDLKSSAQFGYARQLPIAVASNVPHNAFLSEGFEDFKVMHPFNTIYGTALDYNYSPFKESPYAALTAISGQAPYHDYVAGTGLQIDNTAHTGKYSLKTTSSFSMSLPVSDQSKNHNKFFIKDNLKHLISLWIKGTISNNLYISIGGVSTQLIAVTNEIDGWVKYECSFVSPAFGSTVTLYMPSGINADDIRIFPSKSNMKSFVYNDLNYRLMAKLDENNFATFYEYDNEGTLIRTKKETEKGILTLQENRSSNKKN